MNLTYFFGDIPESRKYNENFKTYIGSSDSAELMLYGYIDEAKTEWINTPLRLMEDGDIRAYIIRDDGNTPIPSHCTLLNEFYGICIIQDDNGDTVTYDADRIRIYRTGDFDTLIAVKKHDFDPDYFLSETTDETTESPDMAAAWAKHGETVELFKNLFNAHSWTKELFRIATTQEAIHYFRGLTAPKEFKTITYNDIPTGTDGDRRFVIAKDRVEVTATGKDEHGEWLEQWMCVVGNGPTADFYRLDEIKKNKEFYEDFKKQYRHITTFYGECRITDRRKSYDSMTIIDGKTIAIYQGAERECYIIVEKPDEEQGENNETY